jgi:hypothetical protein
MNKRTNNRKVKRIIIVAVFAIALSVITAFVLVPLVNNKGVRADKKPHETRNVHIPLVNNKDVGADKKQDEPTTELMPLAKDEEVRADKKPDEPTTEYLSDDGWTEYIFAKKVHCGECGKWYDYDEALSIYRDEDHCHGSYSIQDVLVDTIWHEAE